MALVVDRCQQPAITSTPNTTTTHPASIRAIVKGRMAGLQDMPQRTGDVELSVVVPVYGCADCLDTLHRRLTGSVSEITERYELVLIDDRSRDGGWSVLQRLAHVDDHVHALRLSRNFGQDGAITAGLSEARGQWVVVIDCDLEEAPENIPRLWAAAQAGHEIVRTVRRGRRHPPLKRWTSRMYRWLTLEPGTRADYSTLSLISRRVVDAYLRLRDKDREYVITLDWLGFDATAIEIDHAPRHAGTSTYTLQRLIRVALNGIFFRTTILLRLVVTLGFAVALVGIALAIFEIVDYFAQPHKTVPGYTSLAVLLLVLAGFIIISVGVVGLYVGRVFEQVKDRPLFLIDARAGREGDDAEPASAVPGDVDGGTLTADGDRARTLFPDLPGSQMTRSPPRDNPP